MLWTGRHIFGHKSSLDFFLILVWYAYAISCFFFCREKLQYELFYYILYIYMNPNIPRAWYVIGYSVMYVHCIVALRYDSLVTIEIHIFSQHVTCGKYKTPIRAYMKWSKLSVTKITNIYITTQHKTYRKYSDV